MEDTKPLPKHRRIRKPPSHNTGKNSLLHDETACSTPVPLLESSSPASSIKSSTPVQPVKSLSVQTVRSSLPAQPVKCSSSVQSVKSSVQHSSSVQPVKSSVQPVKSSVQHLSVQPVNSSLPIQSEPEDSSIQSAEVIHVSLSTPPPHVESSLPTLVQHQPALSRTNDVVAKHCGIVLRHQDLNTLINHNWLNDQVSLYHNNMSEIFHVLKLQVINYYMKLVMEKHDDIFIFSTFLYTKLLSHGLGSVFHWHKRVDFVNKWLLIFLVHQEAISHWCLAVADVPTKQITCFDSLEKDNYDCLMVLKNFLFKLNGHCH